MMDCGPAALKCLLEGFGIPVSYGRLREACQTDMDGTSIDTIEDAANALGIRAEQHMIPLDHVLAMPELLPALVVVRHSDGPTHFVVVWRRTGSWLQVMDPSIGRRWVRARQFIAEIFRHETSVAADDWRDWAASVEFLVPLRTRLCGLGADALTAAALLETACSDTGWFTFGALDASVRLVAQVVEAGGVKAGPDAVRLLTALFQQTCDSPLDIFRIIPPDYWSVLPDPDCTDAARQRLSMRGAVVLQVAGRISEAAAATEDNRPALSPELAAALSETAPSFLGSLWGLLKADGVTAPLVLAGAALTAASIALVEALLFRGIFDIGALLNLGSQRLMAVLGLLAFLGLMLAIRIPVATESLRLGRRLETRFRMALLAKLPKLADRYFQSRPISDMADRGHSIHVTRQLPSLGISAVQSLCDLLLTLIGISLIDPISGGFALAITVVAIVIPALFQPMINERELRVRNHFAALNTFYLDALLGLVPIRVHRAERAVRRRHESLLVEWARSGRRFIRAGTLAGGLQSLAGLLLASGLLMEHFLRAKGVTGADLLLVFWTLKLPASGTTIAGLALQYPMQRNVLLRLLEPLSAPEPLHAVAAESQAEASAPGDLVPVPTEAAGMGVQILNGAVVAGGHTILRDLDLSVAPGEHVAIVGLSGAGKSSLIGVLLGWHRLAAGRLLIDGAELTEDSQNALRRRTAWIDPAVQIWNQTFLANLNFSAADSDLGRTGGAIDAAHLRGVLQKLPLGLQTPLGEGGALLSGGEGQRVRLGRALVQSDVRLALLDEPFRGMDRDQRSMLLAEARRHWHDITMLCVTHDVSETLAFDRVLVIEDGRICEDDQPARLAAQPSRYRELLDAERLVRDRMWKGKQWRHIRVEDGAVSEGVPVSAAPPVPAAALVYPKAAGGQVQ